MKGKNPAILVVTVLLLIGLSILIVFSTTAVGQSGEPELGMIKKHVGQIIVGLLVLTLTLRIELSRIVRLAPLFLAGSLVLLILVLFVGTSAGGAQRWFAIGPIRVQPGEFAKVAVMLYLATYIGRKHSRMDNLIRGTVIPFSVVGLFGALLLRQPDFGSTAIIFIVVFTQLLLFAPLKHLLGLGAVGALGMGLLIALSPYRFRRFQSFLDPMADSSSSGYQLYQSLIAVGSGGLFGLGLGAGKQKLAYLPAAHTDFIYAVIAEELGLMGALVVIFLFGLIALSGYAAAIRNAENPLIASLAVGATGLLVIPAMLNMGVVLGLLPTKGLVLPFVSYGGTAMVMNFFVLALLVKIYRGETA